MSGAIPMLLISLISYSQFLRILYSCEQILSVVMLPPIQVHDRRSTTNPSTNLTNHHILDYPYAIARYEIPAECKTVSPKPSTRIPIPISETASVMILKLQRPRLSDSSLFNPTSTAVGALRISSRTLPSRRYPSPGVKFHHIFPDIQQGRQTKRFSPHKALYRPKD